MVPAASKEGYRHQAILKFQPRNSFDLSVRYKPQLLSFFKKVLCVEIQNSILCTIASLMKVVEFHGRSVVNLQANLSCLVGFHSKYVVHLM